MSADLHNDDWASTSDIGIDSWDSASSLDDSLSSPSSWDSGSIGSSWDD